ncbi:PapB/FocB family fimbrial expression transcriptional regulator [Shewanella baltica]|uniref:PapB/FocB family fimbrial expression transcriptional regulator n=1 Tax=Shewanella baltica TaxID=62322 RepID=UPI0030D25C2F
MAKKIKELIQGCEKPAQFDLLIAMTSITSAAKINALRMHLVDGFPASRCYARFGVTQQHFSAALNGLNKKADLARRYIAAKTEQGN